MRKIVKIIVMLIGGGFGLMMLYVGVTQFLMQRAVTRNPQRVSATIIQSEVSKHQSNDTNRELLRDNSTTSYRPNVKFAYEFEGRKYESDLIRPTTIVRDYAGQQSAADELKPFPLGAVVQAYVAPSHPDKAYLVYETSSGPVVFIIVGLIVPTAAWAAAKWIV